MADTATPRPLVFTEADWLATEPALVRFVLRGDAPTRDSAGQVLGVALPVLACRASFSGNRAALWLGPDEHLLLAPVAVGAALERDLATALASCAHSLVEVSQRQVGLVVRGPRAESLLESQCPLPLNLRDFPVGMCTRTVFGKAEIVLWRTAEQSFHLEVWRSFSRYVVELLREVRGDQ